jgi:TatD DNase family protein
MAPVVDTHCHMDVTFDDDHQLPSVEVAMSRANAMNVTKVIQVGCDVASSRWAAETAALHSDVWATVALHPNAAAHDPNLDSSLAQIAELAKLAQVRGIGETGLDYYRTERNKAAAQHVSFRAHIDIAKSVNKPLIIHDRDAHDDVIQTLLEYGAPETVIFHCFSGDEQMAQICADHGWYMSIPGVITFRNAESLRNAVRVIPDDLLLVETDSPFLTPVPMRGTPNASTNVPWTVRAICEVRDQSEIEICNLLFSNAERVFGPF